MNGENSGTRADWGMRVHVVTPRAVPENSSPILLLHEVTGVSPECLALAQRLARDGFTVYVPELFGADNEVSDRATRRRLLKTMFSSDWHTLRPTRSPPVLDVVRPLPERISAAHGGKPVGVIGMCLTGSWPLALIGEAPTRVAALCQPTVPFLPWTDERREDIGLSPDDVERATRRIEKERLTVLAFRFCEDSLSTPERLRIVDRICGERGRFIGKTICTHSTRWKIDPRAHSVLCSSYSDEPGHPTRAAYELVVREFSRALKAK